MNFIEAVQALKDGLCESITRESWSGTLLSLSGSFLLQSNGNDSENIKTYVNILADDWELVNPKPQTETVEMLRFECPVCGKYWAKDQPDKRCKCPVPAVRLTGTYEKPIKPKVKRRERIGQTITFNGSDTMEQLMKTKTIPKYANITAEWEE